MELKVKYDVGINQMQKFSFPPIRTGVHVTVAAKEPPERSWSRYKKILIDNPRDSNLLQRQKLWNFQKLNRGAFRSQLSSLPDIPYRVQPNPVEKVSVGVQADLTSRFSQNLRVIFPNLANTGRRFLVNQNSSDTDDVSAVSSDETGSKEKLPEPEQNETDFSDDFEEDSSVEDLGLEFDSVVRKRNAGTMTDPKLGSAKPLKFKRQKKARSFRETNPSVYRQKLSILKPIEHITKVRIEPKNVKFEPEMIEQETDVETEQIDTKPDTLPLELDLDDQEEILPGVSKVEITEIADRVRTPSPASSTGSRLPHIPLENVGPSSNLTSDPISILDYISGSISNRSRNSDSVSKHRAKFVSDPEADRVWFEKIVGDKEIIDSGTYENFARARPTTEHQSDSNNDKYTDLTKSSPRKNFTPKINDEFPVYHSVMSKTPRKQPNNPNTLASTNKGRNIKRGLINIGKSY